MVLDDDSSRYLRKILRHNRNQDWCGVIVCVGPFLGCMKIESHGIWANSGGRRCLGKD